ncbi:hypothetical protein [Vulcanisaeta sp. EB80]|nr:hypothetical protein [Vulcanisaeta sp. EB80]
MVWGRGRRGASGRGASVTVTPDPRGWVTPTTNSSHQVTQYGDQVTR